MTFLKSAVLVCLLGITTSIVSAEEGIKFFEGSWDQVLAEAKAKKKPVFVDCFASWCVPCKMLEKEVFPDKNVGAFYNKNFINYRIDMEKGEGPELAKRYQVRAYPTLLYLDNEGNLLHQIVGKRDAATVIETAKISLNPALRLGQMDKDYEQGNRSDDFLLRYADALANAGKHEKADEVAGVLLDARGESQLVQKENWELIKQYVTNTSGKSFQYVWGNREAFIKQHGEKEVNDYLLNTALNGVKTAGRNNDIDALNKTLIPVIEALTPAGEQEKNALKAQKLFYQAAKDWNNYAVAARAYIDKGYYKINKQPQELEAMLKAKNMTYEEYVSGMEANALNGEAWTFYEHIDNQDMLKAAVKWVETSVQLQRGYHNLDTHAALLFKLGETEKAKQVAAQAIAAAEKEGLDASSTKEMIQQYSGAAK